MNNMPMNQSQLLDWINQVSFVAYDTALYLDTHPYDEEALSFYKASNFGPYYIDHTLAVWPQAAGGVPQNACEFQSKGDPITDLMEDMAADGTTA